MGTRPGFMAKFTLTQRYAGLFLLALVLLGPVVLAAAFCIAIFKALHRAD